MTVNAPALDQATSTIRAAWISALGAILAAVIAAVVALVDGGQTASADRPGASSAAGTPTPISAPRDCGEMVAEVLKLARTFPNVAAAYGQPGTARLPALAEADDVRRCGGTSPERLLESYYSTGPQDGG